MSGSTWTGPPLQVIGLGIEPGGTLSTAARTALDQANVVFGSVRQLAAFPALRGEPRPYPSPLEDLWPQLEALAGRSIALLASGDPLFYGIGATLLRWLSPRHLVFHPNVTSLQAACARIGRPWDRIECLSLHGRPPGSLRAVLRANRLYALLTDRNSQPDAVAGMLTEAGYGDSMLWVAEDLGLADERVRAFSAADLATITSNFSPLNVVIVETRGPGGRLPEFPGIPDDWFETGAEPGTGLLSKREVRLTILSLLEPRAGDVGWDVGAGCGGVSVEWARWNPAGEVYAVECHPERLAHLQVNRERFGVIVNLHVVAGTAPAALVELPDPDAVFVGGSQGRLDELLEVAWQRLRPGGRLVASAVTEDSRVDLYRFAGEQPATWTELRIARGDYLAGQRVLRPYLPVLLMQLRKPGTAG
jgi:precorrin-6Y C5,15-methyltransferase (decarboxylating)